VTALGVAAELPDLVRAIVLEDPPSAAWLSGGLRNSVFFAGFGAVQRLAGPGRSLPEVVRELVELRMQRGAVKVQLGEVRDALFVRFLARCLADLDPATVGSVLEGQWLNGFDLDRAAGAACPVLLVRADDTLGGWLTHAEADQLAGKMADCTRVEVANCGNLIHWLEPEALLRYVLGFLGSL
jgi:pimeloyl-ACP methyl ester carboxylesterase